LYIRTNKPVHTDKRTHRRKGVPEIMLSNPCACFAAQSNFEAPQPIDRQSQPAKVQSKRSKKYAKKPCLFSLSGQASSVAARSDGVVVVNQNQSRPKFPKFSDFERDQVYTWTSSQDAIDGAHQFMRFYRQTLPKPSHATSSTSSSSAGGGSGTPLNIDECAINECSLSGDAVQISVQPLQYRQTVQGFGGALTDAVCINLKELEGTPCHSGTNAGGKEKVDLDKIVLSDINNNSDEPSESLKLLPNGDAANGSISNDGAINGAPAQTLDQELISCYTGHDSAGYQIIRTPISSCDFSARCYTYLDRVDDFDLESFDLQPEDEDKLRWLDYMKREASKAGDSFDLLASSWSAPVWMKSNGKFNGRGTLRGQAGDRYHKTWAQYLLRFLDEYKARGHTYTYMTVQNEPSNGYAIPAFWQSMGWSPAHMRDFIATDLAPVFAASKHTSTKVMMLDDIRMWLPGRPQTVLSDERCRDFIAGIGVHWYMNHLFGTSKLEQTHAAFEDKFLLGTEACHEAAPMPPSKTNVAEQWQRGEKYSKDIITSMNHWQTGWIDWNLCLSLEGGPNCAQNLCDSPIIVNGGAKEFYLQPMYFHMTHFSKLLVKGSRVIKPNITNNKAHWYWKTKKLQILAAQRPDESILLTVLNLTENGQELFISDIRRSVSIPAKTIKSILFFL